MDPARADHIPVMEYSSGVTVLLFWATNTSEKSCVTSACSMAPVGEQGADQQDGRQQPGVGHRALRWRRRPGIGPAGESPAGHEADDADDDAGDARHEGEPDADGPQIRVEHQQTGPDDVTFTRFGYWAV